MSGRVSHFGNFAIGIANTLHQAEFAGGPLQSIGRVCAGNIILREADGTGKFAEFLTLHLGSKDQSRDRTIQAHEGYDDTPTFSGIAYFVAADLPLAHFRNAIPDLFTIESTSYNGEQFLITSRRADDLLWSIPNRIEEEEIAP